MKSPTTLELSQNDRNFLEAIKKKTDASSNAEILRTLIRKEYFRLSKTKLSKAIEPGKEFIFKGITQY